MAQVNRITPAAGVTLQGTPTTQPGKGGIVNFRTATDRKYEIGSADTLAQTAAQQSLTRVIEGTGYLSSIDIQVDAVNSGTNSAAVAFQPDAPWSALANVAFKAIGPDLINITGYSLYLLNLYGGHGVMPGFRGAGAPATLTAGVVSQDPLVYDILAGSGAKGGHYHFTLKLPCAINPRNLIGLMGNQDAGTKYQLTTDLAANAALYSTLPTQFMNVTISRFLDYCAVPAALDAQGMQQQQVPPSYGVLHMANELRSEANPVAGATVNHFLRSLGNTDRLFILVFRNGAAGTPRTDAMLPTRISLRVGADVKYSETSAHRRKVMYDRYGFDAPAGVLVYDFISDFVREAGFELGDDWFNSSNIPNAQFECAYPTFASSPGSLTIITDQLVIPSTLDVKSYV